jgi:hypothetical protein
MQRARATSGCAISRVDLSGLASIKLNRTNEDQPACYPSSDLKYCDDEVCILSNSGSTIFYHCLEELYKVVILERHEFGGRYVVAGMPGFATEFMQLLSMGRERIMRDIAEPTVLRSAVLTTRVCHRDVIAYRGVSFALVMPS